MKVRWHAAAKWPCRKVADSGVNACLCWTIKAIRAISGRPSAMARRGITGPEMQCVGTRGS